MKSFLIFALSNSLLLYGDTHLLAGSDEYREVMVHVVNEFEQPEGGVEVDLHPLWRGQLDALDLFHSDATPSWPEDAQWNGWKFKTDADGNCTVRFGKFNYWEHYESTCLAEPGYGEFYLVVYEEGVAGGVSPRILNLNDEDRRNYKERDVRDLDASGPTEWDAWRYGEFQTRLLEDDPAQDEPMTIKIRGGFEVSGRVINQKGRPLAGQGLRLWNDLHADTHTGHGGEIFSQETETDRSGHFYFHHVYPNLFYLALEGQDDDQLIWLKTRVRRRWIDGVADMIWPHQDDVDLSVTIVATKDLPYRYFGSVTDEHGKPIGGATVTIQAAIHGPGGRVDFEDGHDHHSQARTRRDGSYEIFSAGQYVNWFQVTAAGFKQEDYMEDGKIYDWNLYEEVPCAPGRYDFQLKRE